MTQQILEDPADALASTLFRNFVASPIWLARILLGQWALPIDGVLVALYVFWVNKPLEISLGSLYAKRPHWSSLVVIPTIFAIYLLVRDAIVAGRAILHLG